MMSVYSMQRVAARGAGLVHTAQSRSANKLQCVHHQSGQYTGEQHQCQLQSPPPPHITGHPLEGTLNTLTDLYLDSRDDKCCCNNKLDFAFYILDKKKTAFCNLFRSTIGLYHCELFWRYHYLYRQGHYHCVCVILVIPIYIYQAVGIGIARITHSGNEILMKE